MSATFIAAVLLKAPLKLTKSSIADVLANCPESLGVALDGVSEDGKQAKFTVQGMRIALQMFDTPAPIEGFERELRGSREGPLFEAISGHGAQMSVFCRLQDVDMGQGVLAAAAVHVLAAHLGAMGEPLAGYWVSSERLSPWDVFVQDGTGTAAAFDETGAVAFPSRYWVSVQLIREGESFGGRSIGLAPFTGYELAMPPIARPMEFVAERMVGTLEYLFQAGPVLRGGETLGATESERFRIVERPEDGLLLLMLDDS